MTASLAVAATHGNEQRARILGATLSSISDFAYIFDRDGRFLFANQPLLKLWGIDLDTAVGRNYFDLGYPPELAARLQQEVQDVFESRKNVTGETSYTMPGGDESFYEYILSPDIAADGTVEFVAGSTRDVTQRKAGERHLAHMESRYRGLLEAAPDAMVVVNERGDIVLVNVQAEKQFGYRRDELLGQQVRSIIPEGFAERIIADGTRTAAEALAQQIGTGIELLALRKNGTEFPIEMMLSPLESDEGILVTAAIRDITARKAAEKYLGQMEGRYRGLLEAAPDAMVVVNQDGEIVMLNVQAQKQFGYRRDELLGQQVRNIIPEGFAERIIADGTRTAAEALAQQIGTGIELSGHRKDGSEFPIEIMLSPLQNSDGILVTAAIRDISVRKAAERLLAETEEKRRGMDEQLRQSQERYRMLIDRVEGYAIFMVDPEGQVLSWNAGAERIKGYRAEEIIGRNFSCFFPADAISRGRPAEVLRIAAARGSHEEQGMRVRKNGSSFLASVTFTALRNAAGDLQGFSEVSHDLSESESSQARYRGLLEAAPDAMVVVDQHGAIVLLNVQAEKQLGYRRDELIGQQMTNIIPEGFAERLLTDSQRSAEDALSQEIGAGIELNARRKDGTTFPIEIMLSPLESPDGVLVTAAIRDISSRKEAEELLLQKVAELRRSNEELEHFAYLASHDLQEPLRMVASYTQLLSRRYTGKLDSDADEFIAFAVDGASRMQRLIQDLLAYSRVGTKGGELLATPAGRALDEAMSNLRATIEDSGAVITHGPLPSVLADETQLVQLFQNLIGNAIKYQDGRVPEIHVSAERNGAGWTFAVRDNGLGIDAKYFEKIFGMFQRLHGRKEYAGTGIGLAICKKIVERHGGTIGVESAPGQGSTFRFELTGSETTSTNQSEEAN